MPLIIAREITALSAGGYQTMRAATALKHAAAQRQNADAIVAAGAVPLLTRWLQSDGTPELQDECAAALRALCLGNDANRNAVRNAGAVPLLVALLADQSTAAETQEQAAGLLSSLAMQCESACAIVAGGGVAPLLRACASGCNGIELDATSALRGLAAHPECHHALVEAVPTLKAMRDGGSRNVAKMAAAALELLEAAPAATPPGPTAHVQGAVGRRLHLHDESAQAVADSRALLSSLGLSSTPHMRSSSTESPCVLLLVPGAGHADVDDAAADGLVPCGLWSTAKHAVEHGLQIASMGGYVTWALSCAAGGGVRPVVLRSHSDEAVASALDSLEADASPKCSNGTRPLRIVIAAHSEGGAAVVRALCQRESWLPNMGPTPAAVLESGTPVELSGVALLDSVHSSKDLPPKGSRAAAYMRSGAVINWVTSGEPLGHPKPRPWVRDGLLGGVLACSAGSTEHLAVPSAVCEAACAFLELRLAQGDRGECADMLADTLSLSAVAAQPQDERKRSEVHPDVARRADAGAGRPLTVIA